MIDRVVGRRVKVFAAALALVGGSLLTVDASPASAHNWGNWHWDRTGSQIVIYNYIYGGTTAQAEAARQDGWNKIGILYNYASSLYIQGVYCQEIFHTYGFDHSNTGDCMGLGYFSSTTYYYGPHNNDDFYNRYRFH